jgi:hypothetical protein
MKVFNTGRAILKPTEEVEKTGTEAEFMNVQFSLRFLGIILRVLRGLRIQCTSFKPLLLLLLSLLSQFVQEFGLRFRKVWFGSLEQRDCFNRNGSI